jgi:Domain of Unknown Function (DUF326)
MQAVPLETVARAMLDSYPGVLKLDAAPLAATIDALHECVQTCTADADDDLREQNVANLVKCIRLCRDCADVCATTTSVITRQTEFDPTAIAPLLQACATMCRVSGDECERHAHMHAHCRICAEVSRRCEQACRDLLAAMA